ncbi:hypothetical protein [Archaeoglobus veneficus]|uniref:Uncharacterized protein n=1 Tax=Archaeoglobus veneficus (strain DSM 11195 / SNP6) TaxID=693661 RepID=F2KRD1_ARCVS|nr:hypothetical protein [Archaeoglobus veneficus]AEA47865.1 hypothetical protein Arcve_1872 [Archaeoglobus veneficus SNP6]
MAIKEYLVFLLLGAVSAPLSFALGGILTSANLLRLEGPSELLFALIVCSVLFAAGLYFLKPNYALKGFGIAIALSLAIYLALLFDPRLIIVLLVLLLLTASLPVKIPSSLRAFAISCLALLLAFGAIFAWSAYEHYSAKYIEVKKLDYPDKFVNLTEKEIEGYPALKKAIRATDEQSWAEVIVSPDEYFKLKDALSDFRYVKINGEYYRIWLTKFVSVHRLGYEPANYAEVAEEEMGRYPSLEKVVSVAVSGSGIHNINTSREEFYQIMEFIDSIGNVILYKGVYLEISTDCRIYLKKLQYPPSDYASVSKEELAEYEVIRKAIEAARSSEDGKAIMKVKPEEWDAAMDFLHRKGSNVIEFEGKYYEFSFMTA